MGETATFSSFHRTPLRDRLSATGPIEVGNDAPHSESPPVNAEAIVAGPEFHRIVENASDGLDASPDTSTAISTGIARVSLYYDQLGLASPLVVSLRAQLQGYYPVPLEAGAAGIYRPTSFRPAPWSGFAYDMAVDALTGMAAGTRILTARGEIEVEKLLPGDVVMTLRGPALLPIMWIGRSVAVVPSIVISAGAFGQNLPRRELYIGRGQAVFLSAAPVLAQNLLNGTTVREADVTTFDLFHIDVGRVEVLMAEGVPLASGQRASMSIG